MTRTLALDALADHLAETQGPVRRVVAIAGAPGSGKSTFVEALRDRIGPRVATEILPMDGFHFDDIVLNARGDRPRKGAPHTFDSGGLAATLDRLTRDDGASVAVPVFDRAIEIARAGARIIGPDARLILAEGNYLLLDDPDWTPLRRFYDLTVFLQVPMPVLRARLTDRWVGYALTPDQIAAKLDGNDLLNAERVAAASLPADIVVQNDTAAG